MDKKTSIFILAILALFIVGCGTSDEVVNAEPDQTGNAVEVTVNAFRFGFEPSTIQVDQGDLVKITAQSLDVPHGLAIQGYNINMDLGKTPTTKEFLADKKGEFRIYCSVPCGAEHGSMQGKLIVK